MVDYCCGCCNDLTKKKKERRILSSAKSQHVFSLWKGCLDKFGVSLEQLPPGVLV